MQGRELDSAVEPGRTQLREALAALYGLLEEYSPQWYSQELREKALRALQMLK